ncbi:O-antigen ligase family protein [Pseudovibrio sp. Tun.PSC04-5.I4]|uniref:O-antigen ligase family protein n=1 Tax=Pseudovibrio sp. Tun.PSC04-5.I4 TaxID=1798213 RepID=UPI000890FA90|nr:O-antigen ligase family protein [Pseudovibrio sp. Tun.PSC04-5.I4]SDR12476.1 O-antigen ligase like membrane protein [Pseudovibrio sp. Tun.PSC04-5.I4]
MTDLARPHSPTKRTRPFLYVPLMIGAEQIARGLLFLATAMSALVIIEPAPYDLMIAVLLVGWSFFGLELRKDTLPLLVLLCLYIAGGIMALPAAEAPKDALTFYAVTVFLACSSFLYAATLSANMERMEWIEKGYMVAALFATLLAIAGYFNAFPGAYDQFTLYGRAKGTFKDPNVYGPFLLLPTLFIVYDILTKPIRANFFKAGVLLILLLGTFLSFSRAAWGMTLGGSFMVFLLVFINERRSMSRLKLLGLLGLAGIGLFLMILAILSIDSISEMFTQRAKLVQDYDGARLGRFGRWGAGFTLVTEAPFGLGAGGFSNIFPEDEHNSYLKAFTTYGWLGGLSYVTLVFWTLIKAFPLVFKPRPWQKYIVCAYVAFLLHACVSFIIDSDHWRHYFLLLGILWAVIAAEAGISRYRRFPPTQ